MQKLTPKAARALQESFKGRIASSHEAHAEFPGRPTVLVPESVEDVERALGLARAANRRVFVRSGRSVSTADVAPAAAKAGVVLSMEALRDVDVGDRKVTVGAAATTGDVAGRLPGPGLFLPLDDNRARSVVSTVLSMGASPFLRSGAGSLRDAVVEATAVPTDGPGAGRARRFRDRGLRSVLTGVRPAVITELVLDADPVKAGESDRWTQLWTAVYERKTFSALCTALFGAAARAVPGDVDLSVRVTSAAYSMKLVIVRATGRGDHSATEAIVQAALGRAKPTVLDARRETGPGPSVAAWVSTGPGEAAPGDVPARFGSNAAPREFATFRSAFVAAVDFAVGVDPRTGRERAPRVRAWAELQLAPSGGVIARAEVSDTEAEARVARAARARMAKAIPADGSAPRAAAPKGLARRGTARAALRGVPVLTAVAPTAGFAITPNNRAGDRLIPGFKGDLLDRTNGGDYLGSIEQYASSSYPKSVRDARMTPRYVAVPVDADDVARAVTFAALLGLKVVGRSGGHQYCGLSSGGDDTLLMDMRLFTRAEVVTVDGAPALVAGPGAALRDASRALRAARVALPHGECPLVRLGGHVQTGGIGHQLRSLGATLDWVRSFRMVARDPASPPGADAYAEREFKRPGAGAGAADPTDDDVFRAVLGGGPGGWGVLTEVTFDVRPDESPVRSSGYSYPYPYRLLFGSAKEGFRVAMEQLRRWAERESRGQLPQGVDLFLSVISGDFPRPPVLLVETMCTDPAGLPEIRAVVDAIDAAVPGAIRLAARAAAEVNGPAALSVIADEGVRDLGWAGMPGGREFSLPYKKSLHATRVPFSQAFRDAFVELVDDAYSADGLEVVFQGVVGGGRFGANGQGGTTHMQRRDALVQLVFDVFYRPGFERAAAAMQARMRALLGQYSGGEDVRMFWGSFEDEGTHGAQLDMGRPATQALYYDSGAGYARLQRIKEYADPRDVFRTSFTVRLP